MSASTFHFTLVSMTGRWGRAWKIRRAYRRGESQESAPKAKNVKQIWKLISFLIFMQTIFKLNLKSANTTRSSFFFFLKILFVYLTEIETAKERGMQAGGVREEETGFQQRSPMQGLIPECRDHPLSRRQTLNDWATQVSLGACFFLSHSPCLCSLSHWLSFSVK